MGYLPKKLYEDIIRNMPIFCLDLVIIKDNRVLLIKRENHPMKGIYFTPGGRVYKNERIECALKRKAKEEIGIEIEKIHPLAFYEFFFKDSQVKDATIHGVGWFYLCRPVEKDFEIKLDAYASDYKWEGLFSPDLHLILKEMFDGKTEIYYKEKKDE